MTLPDEMVIGPERRGGTPMVGILGIGNILIRDEGFGVHCVQRLQELYQVPDNVEVLDGGTAGIMLAPFIESVDLLYVIDTVNGGGEPGSIHCFSDSDVRAGNIQGRMSPHQLGLLEILSLCQLRGEAPEQVELITVVPQDLSTGLGLSPVVEARIPEVIDMLIDRLDREGIVFKSMLQDNSTADGTFSHAFKAHQLPTFK